MKRTFIFILAIWCAMIISAPVFSSAQSTGSIITATSEDVPINESVPAEYSFQTKYQADAVQFRTEDGVLLSGWVIGEGTKGITLGHANGWGTSSWQPFGERLVDAGYMIIIWEFRNNYPSGNAAPGAEKRWELDVLAAVQVLRERGVTEIIAMGASDGGNATAVAAPNIPELVGIGILSSPSMSVGDGPSALSQITVPAFFAVSNNDPGTGGGDRFLQEVQKLYDACASEQKELHVLTSYEHGTDLLSDVDVYSRLIGSTEEQKQERRQLADDLLQFVNNTFSPDTVDNVPESSSAESAQPTENDTASSSAGITILPLAAVAVIAIVVALVIGMRKRRS